MQALTLKHPWPYLIRDCGKRVENRKWRPEPRQIGQWIALHGGAPPAPGKAWDEAQADHAWAINNRLAPVRNLSVCIIAGIFAVCRIGEPVRQSDDLWFFGPWAWPLLDFTPLPEPIPCKGRLGLWELPEDVLALVRAQYKEVKP